jgi:hypothetical protein
MPLQLVILKARRSIISMDYYPDSTDSPSAAEGKYIKQAATSSIP